AAVERPVLGDRQRFEIDLVSGLAVFVESRLALLHLARRDAALQLVLDAADKLQRRRIGRLFERERDALEAGTEDVPQMARTDRALLEALGLLHQDRRRGIL